MKLTLSLSLAAALISTTATAYGNIYARSAFSDDLDLVDYYARDAEPFDDDLDLYARDAEPFEEDDELLLLVARELAAELYARNPPSRSSSSSSSSGLFQRPLGSGSGAPAGNGGFSPQSPGLGSHFTYTGAYTLDANGGRRQSTGSSNAIGDGRPAPPPRRKTARRSVAPALYAE
ncbi:MAG: hypothetical protein LQ340_003554 [Diploschistes diacapsis]|nr:MAG: hypothetical protein LQ340_003554 [Diploschistes diacapsis]